jgi:hypothetical protein
MATAESVIVAIDQVIAFFNTRRMDLPDGLFDRTTQFVINGAPFETLLGQNPNDPLILMLARGPAGFRFTVKGLQHALRDAHVDREEVTAVADPSTATTRLRLSGLLRDTAEAITAVVDVTLRLNAAGTVARAEAALDEVVLEKIRQARRS